jgi:hypothetical protein
MTEALSYSLEEFLVWVLLGISVDRGDPLPRVGISQFGWCSKPL